MVHSASQGALQQPPALLQAEREQMPTSEQAVVASFLEEKLGQGRLHFKFPWMTPPLSAESTRQFLVPLGPVPFLCCQHLAWSSF